MSRYLSVEGCCSKGPDEVLESGFHGDIYLLLIVIAARGP